MEEFIYNLCKGSGQILLKYFGKNLSQSEKQDAGFVTQADIESENYIINQIKNSFPHSDIIAEESGENIKNNPLKWIIDPLDGTTNFAGGVPFFAISIALEEEGVLSHSAVYNPITEEFFYAARGKGVFLNKNPVSISQKEDFSKAVFSTGDYYYRGNRFKKSMDLLNKIYEECRTVRITGSVALSLSYIASGKFDGFWQESFNYWDVAAGILMIKEAGGIVVDFDGQEIKAGGPIIATNNKLLHKTLDVIGNF